MPGRPPTIGRNSPGALRLPLQTSRRSGHEQRLTQREGLASQDDLDSVPGPGVDDQWRQGVGRGVLGLFPQSDDEQDERVLLTSQVEPPDGLVVDHRDTLISATSEITALAESNRELLDSSYRALQETLGLLSATPEPSTYTADGATSPPTTRRLFDQST